MGSRMSMRHTVGAAQRLVTGNCVSVCRTSTASKRPPGVLLMKMVQPALSGAYTLLDAQRTQKTARSVKGHRSAFRTQHRPSPPHFHAHSPLFFHPFAQFSLLVGLSFWPLPPSVLGPSWGRDVPVDVGLLQPEPVHGPRRQKGPRGSHVSRGGGNQWLQ